jgi:hypothetical protein
MTSSRSIRWGRHSCLPVGQTFLSAGGADILVCCLCASGGGTPPPEHARSPCPNASIYPHLPPDVKTAPLMQEQLRHRDTETQRKRDRLNSSVSLCLCASVAYSSFTRLTAPSPPHTPDTAPGSPEGHTRTQRKAPPSPAAASGRESTAAPRHGTAPQQPRGISPHSVPQ